MKIDSSYPTAPKAFKPFTLPLLIETKEQAAAMHAIFNNTQIIRFLRSRESGRIRKYISKKSGINSDKDAFEALLTILK